MALDHALMAVCGAYCGDCDWKERIDCPGCRAAGGDMVWGACQVAQCALQKGYAHCGDCPTMPCGALQDTFDEPEHGDGGERLANLQAWARGEETYIVLGTFPRQKDAPPATGEP